MTDVSETWGPGRVTARGVAAVLAFGGAMLIRSAFAPHAASGRALIGVALILVAIGVWKFWRLARWMALGACFLAVFAACVIPVYLFLMRSSGGQADGLGKTILEGLIYVAFGAAGYVGLGYLRSEHARHEFAGSATGLEQLLAEKSSAVAYSAGAWVVLSVIAIHPALISPTRLFSLLSPKRESVDSAGTKTHWLTVLRKGKRISAGRAPDILPLGLCYQDHRRERVIHIVYTNAGGNAGSKEFRYGSGTDLNSPQTMGGTTLAVPKGDTLLLAEYGLDDAAVSGPLLVTLDVGSDVKELDETNNTARFELQHNADGTVALPECGTVQLRIAVRHGPTLGEATVRQPAPRPDLVPLGFCSRGQILLSLQFTNRGVAVSGLFWISQGSGSHDLKVNDRVYHPVTATGAPRGFTIGTFDQVIGGPGQSIDIAVKLDAADSIQESNEMNNFVAAHLERRADGTVDLPECDALEELAHDPTFIADDVALQPAFIPLPDLVPLGLCVKDWGLDSQYLEVVYGNVGTVSSPVGFYVDMHDAVLKPSPNYREEFHVNSPDGLNLARTALHARDARSSEVVTVDPTNVVLELSESNNTMRFDIARKADGSPDLPDCESIRGRASEWNGKMQSITGPE